MGERRFGLICCVEEEAMTTALFTVQISNLTHSDTVHVEVPVNT